MELNDAKAWESNGHVQPPRGSCHNREMDPPLQPRDVHQRPHWPRRRRQGKHGEAGYPLENEFKMRKEIAWIDGLPNGLRRQHQPWEVPTMKQLHE